MDGFDNEEQLTQAELEDIRRERAAARRRKMAARERRRKKRRQQAIIRCSILLIAVILILFIIVKLITGIAGLFTKDKKKKPTTETQTTQELTTEAPVAEIDESIVAVDLPADRSTAIAMLQSYAQTNSGIQNILDNEAVYPDIIIRHLAANLELTEFTQNYIAKINIVFDGNFSVDVVSNEVPLFLQYDERWGYADYANDLVALSGSAPTCLSMAYTYLKQDGSMNPIKIADYSTEKGYVNDQGYTDSSLITEGCSGLGMNAEELSVSEENIQDTLNTGNVIICSMSTGDFTKTNSYIILKEYKDGFYYVNDPSSEARSNVGWDFKRLSSQINGMWALSASDTNVTNPEVTDPQVTTQSPDVSNETGTTASGDATSSDTNLQPSVTE